MFFYLFVGGLFKDSNPSLRLCQECPSQQGILFLFVLVDQLIYKSMFFEEINHLPIMFDLKTRVTPLTPTLADSGRTVPTRIGPSDDL